MATYKRVYEIYEQNHILQEGGTYAIEKLYPAYEKQLDDFAVKVMKQYGQKLTSDRIKECQSAAKLAFCKVVQSKPRLNADIMCYSQEAVRHAVLHELFGKNQMISGERNLIKLCKVMAARETLIQRKIKNPTAEQIYEELCSVPSQEKYESERNSSKLRGVQGESVCVDENEDKDTMVKAERKHGNRGKVTKDGKVYDDISLRFIKNVLFEIVSLDGFQEGVMPTAPQKGPEEQMQDTELGEAIKKIFSVLSEKELKLLTLQESDMTQKEIAQFLEMTPGEYRFWKSILVTYFAAALMALGYEDLQELAHRKQDVVVNDVSDELYLVFACMKADEQKVFMGLLNGRKQKKGGTTSGKIVAVLSLLAKFDLMYDGRFGYAKIARSIIQ